MASPSTMTSIETLSQVLKTFKVMKSKSTNTWGTESISSLQAKVSSKEAIDGTKESNLAMKLATNKSIL